MRRIAILGVLFGVALAPRDADACSCIAESPIISPPENATAVPLNAVVSVQRYYGDVLLLDATQTEVPTTKVQVGGWTVLQPNAPLAANTAYQIAFPSSEPIATTFMTGTATDTTAVDFAGITAWTGETMTYPISGCISSCIEDRDGRISRGSYAMPALPADAAVAELVIVRASDRAEIGRVVLDPADGSLGFDTCSNRQPAIEPDVEYCARVRVYDVAMNVAGDTVEVCSTASACAPVARDERGCEPADTCAPISSDGGGGGCATSDGAGVGALLLVGAALVRRRR